MKITNILKEKYYTEYLSVGCAVIAYFIIEIINFSGVSLELFRIIANTLPFYIIGKIFFIVFRDIRWSVIGTIIVAYLYGTINYFVYMFRGTPFLPWDIRAIKTAATVAENYRFEITLSMIVAFLIAVIYVIVCFCVQDKCEKLKRKEQFKKNALILVVGIIVYAIGICPFLKENIWDPQCAYEEQGVLSGFVAHIPFCFVDKPAEYSIREVEELLLTTELIKAEGIEAQNIIIIMNESFCDLRVINNEIISDDYMPYIDSLTDNTIKGNIYVPVFGGYTCDSEFEVLVGASTAYTAQIPYQTSLVNKTESLATYLKERGFGTYAFHPFDRKNWNRDKVYEYLGFDEYISIEDVGVTDGIDVEIVRWVVGDRTDYEKVIYEYEKHNDEKFFMFNVTMQNHGGYEEDYDGFETTVDLSAYGEFPQAEQYLTLIKESDAALRELIEYFSNVGEPTLICFFGDHCPTLEDEFYDLLYGQKVDSLSAEERQLMHVTPVIIWTNYDIEERYIDKISTNFLALEILNTANIDLEGYYSVLNDIYEQYPVISKNGIIDVDGNWYEGTDLSQNDMVLLQRKIQYHRIYDNND